jgi:hypothetical protein
MVMAIKTRVSKMTFKKCGLDSKISNVIRWSVQSITEHVFPNKLSTNNASHRNILISVIVINCLDSEQEQCS